MAGRFAGQVCVVTGGTQGIGWALVAAFAAAGAQVFACGRSLENLARGEAARTALPWAERIVLAQVDVTDEAALVAWLGGIAAQTGRLDILVHNAAYVQWDDVAAMRVDQAQLTMRVAYDALVVAVTTALPGMLAAGHGRIVVIGSIAGAIFVGGQSAAYAAAKAALHAYARTLDVELRGSGVGVTLVVLGTVAGTDFFKKHVSEARMPPLTRLMPALTPPQVARSVVAAVARGHGRLTLPRYLGPLRLVYELFPRSAVWLAQRGGQRRRNYDQVEWRTVDEETP